MDENLEQDGGPDGSKRLLLIADTHFSLDEVDTIRDTADIWKYGDKYGCDELVVGGDISESVEDAAKLYLEEVFDSFRVARGNHDTWSPEDLYREVRRNTEDAGSILVGDHIKWPAGNGENEYLIGMCHRPHDFHIRSKRQESGMEWEEDIILYGHSHAPYDRVLGKDDTLAIGIGSTFSNYNIPYESGRRLKRSFQILEIEDDGIKIMNYDFDRDILIEEAVYGEKGGGFEEIYKDYNGVPEYPDRSKVSEPERRVIASV